MTGIRERASTRVSIPTIVRRQGESLEVEKVERLLPEAELTKKAKRKTQLNPMNRLTAHSRSWELSNWSDSTTSGARGKKRKLHLACLLLRWSRRHLGRLVLALAPVLGHAATGLPARPMFSGLPGSIGSALDPLGAFSDVQQSSCSSRVMMSVKESPWQTNITPGWTWTCRNSRRFSRRATKPSSHHVGQDSRDANGC